MDMIQRARLRLNCYNNYNSVCPVQKSMVDVRETLLLTMELEDTRAKAQTELKLKDAEISKLREMVRAAISHRDEARDKYQKLLHLMQTTPNSGISSVEDDPKRALDNSINGFSSSDCDESIVSSAPSAPPVALVTKPLPEKGKLLEAVMKAGPLLQNLLLAGPLPQWRQSPPPVDNYQIPPPPVVVPPALSQSSKKRPGGLPDSGGEFKCQRVALQ